MKWTMGNVILNYSFIFLFLLTYDILENKHKWIFFPYDLVAYYGFFSFLGNEWIR